MYLCVLDAFSHTEEAEMLKCEARNAKRISLRIFFERFNEQEVFREWVQVMNDEAKSISDGAVAS